jgi:zinc transport system ATP-binding protein
MHAFSRAVEPRLTARSLRVRRGSSSVVEGLDLEIRPGGVYWVVGPNGSGKTSLLRVLVGLDRPAAGRVHRRTAPERPFLYFHSEMSLPASSTVGDWERLVRRVLPAGGKGSPTSLRPDVEPRRPVRRLSTGERKRLLLDGLLRRPGSLLLDEPFEHLSPEAKDRLTGLLEARSFTDVVVVATNQATRRAGGDGGLRLGEGTARRLRPGRPR